MHRVAVFHPVVKDDPVTLPGLYLDGIDLRPKLIIDGPAIEWLALVLQHLEGDVEFAVGFGVLGLSTENGVVPRRRVRRSNPLRLPLLSRVLHDDAHSEAALGIAGRTQNPDARLIHLDHR